MTAEMPADTGERGECADCQHVRQGGSITNPTFSVLLDALKPKVSSSHTQKMQEELEDSGQAPQALETAKEYKVEQWNRRPTALMPYCGVDEFQGKYYVTDVKNFETHCPQFKSRHADPTPHNCKTCSHSAAPLSQVLLTVQQVLGKDKEGRDLRMQQVDPGIEAQANIEYRDCVDGQGQVLTRPGLLPVCDVYSLPSPETGDLRYVVGPVVNTAARCPAWEQGPSPRNQRIQAHMAALQAEAARSEDMSNHPPAVLFNQNLDDVLNPLNSAAGNDQADIIEFGLTVLGLNADFVQTIGSSFMDSSWYLPRVREIDPATVLATIDAGNDPPPVGAGPVQFGQVGGQSPIQAGYGVGAQAVFQSPSQPGFQMPSAQVGPTAQPAMPAQSAPQPSPPFVIQPMVAYRHPSYPQISFQVIPTGTQILVLVRIGDGGVQFDLGALAPGVWTQLRTPQGPLPITLLPQPPLAVYGAWY